MSARKKVVATATPQSWAEANALLEEYSRTSNDLVIIAAELDAAVAAARKPFDERAAPLQARLEEIFNGVEIWATANRATITDANKTKTVKMAAAAIGWRTCPPSVEFKRPLKGIDIVKNIFALMKALSQDKDKERRRLVAAARGFIRYAMEPNKKAMLDNQNLAGEIAGVKIITGVEEFFIDPTQAELTEAK